MVQGLYCFTAEDIFRLRSVNMKIGKVAGQAGITVETVRFYEKKGIAATTRPK